MSNTKKLENINRRIAPFRIVDLDDGLYSLSLRFSFFEGEYKDYGREAFNSYAVKNGESVKDWFGFYTHGSGYEWEQVFQEAFRDRDLSQLDFDSEAGSFFCRSKDLSLLEKLAKEFKAICEDAPRLDNLVCAALDRAAAEECRTWDMSM